MHTIVIWQGACLNQMHGSEIRHPVTAQEPGFHIACRAGDGRRYRREHGGFQRSQRGVAQAAPLPRPGPNRHSFATLEERHFRGPVFAGDTVRTRSKVLDKEVRSRGRRGVVTWQRQVVNQEGRVVQEGVTMTLVEGRAATQPPTPTEAKEEPAEE